MEEFFPILFIFFILAVMAIAFMISFASAKNLKDAYRRLAEQTGGTFQDGGLFGLPTVMFYHGHLWVRVTMTKTGGKNSVYYTEFHTAWPDSSFRCEVYPEKMFQRLGKFFGMEDIEIGSPDFDRDFILTSNSRSILQSVLSGQAQVLIGQLQHLLGNREIYVNISGGTLQVRKKGRIAEFETLRRFVQLSLQLQEATIDFQQGGIEFLEASPRQPPEVPTCQICGEEIFEDKVNCRRCKTPHHRECWEFYGACSTYACGEKNFVYPRG